jgi:enoyl-CoA hydratase
MPAMSDTDKQSTPRAPEVLTRLADGILTITLNRPDKLNALDATTVRLLEQAVARAREDDGVKGVIITGAGDRAFSAGADIKELSRFTPEQGRTMVENGQRALQGVEDCPKPVVAAVNGIALGGGCELAMACHLRVASATARFGLPEMKLGLIPAYGGTQRLIRLLGRTRALELMLTGGSIGARAAERLGLVNVVVPAGEVLARSEALLRRIVEQPALSVRGILACANACAAKQTDGYAVEIERFVRCMASEDFQEGVKAFLEKRPPRFAGR